MHPHTLLRAELAAVLCLAGLHQDPPCCASGRAEPARVERRLAAMGTWLDLELAAPERPLALAASERAVRAIEACEARLSTWREDSELARLNHAAVGEVVTLSSELAADLARARGFWLATEGAFDPGLAALVAAWGLRSGGRSPAPEELASALAAGGLAGFELDGRRAVRRHPLAGIEEGGFGKGVGLDAALAALAEAGITEARIDLGGQLGLLGSHGPSPWTVVLADPRDRARAVLELRVDAGSFSTSGNSEHGILVDGVRHGHLLDPRSGQPAEDFGSLSVWAGDATAADCLSTGLYVLGPTQAFRWRTAHRANEPVELIVLAPHGERLVALASEGWRGRLRPLVPGLELRFVSEDAARLQDPFSLLSIR
jgi:thiamine biosynthesis lipoprotein